MEEENQAGFSNAFNITQFEEGEEVNGNYSDSENADEQQDYEIMEHENQQNDSRSFTASEPGSAQNDTDKLITEVADLSTENFKIKLQLDLANDQLETTYNHINEIEKKRLDGEQKVKSLERNKCALKNKLKDSEAEHEKLKLKITILEKSLEEKDKLIKEMENENQVLNEKLDTKESEVKEINAKYINMKNTCETETDNCNVVTDKLTLSEKRVKELENKLTKQRASAKDLVLMKMNLENITCSLTRHIENYEDDLIERPEQVNEEERLEAKVSEGEASDDELMSIDDQEPEVVRSVSIEDEEQEAVSRTTRSTHHPSTSSKCMLVKQDDSPQRQLRGGRPTSSGKGRKPFTCSYLNCNKKFFATADALKRHEMQHKKKKRTIANPDYISPGLEEVGNSAGDQEGTYEGKFCAAVQSVGINNNSVDNNVVQRSSHMYEIVEIG